MGRRLGPSVVGLPVVLQRGGESGSMDREPSTAMLMSAGGQMRARSSEHTLRWILDELDATDIVAMDAMPGGSTSAMHRDHRRGPRQSRRCWSFVLGMRM
jgi:hypothetical protein